MVRGRPQGFGFLGLGTEAAGWFGSWGTVMSMSGQKGRKGRMMRYGMRGNASWSSVNQCMVIEVRA